MERGTFADCVRDSHCTLLQTSRQEESRADMTTVESFPSNKRVAVKGALEGVREAVTELRKTLHKWGS